MSTAGSPAAARSLALAAALLALGVTCGYWYLISTQGDQHDRRPQLVAASLILAVLAMLASLGLRSHSWRLLLLSIGSSTLLVWSILGALSIGFFLVPSVLLSLAAASKESALMPLASAWSLAACGAIVSLLGAWLVVGVS